MMVAGGWGWQTLGSSVCGSLWKPWTNREEDHQPWVDFVLGWVKGRCWDRKGAQRRDLALPAAAAPHRPHWGAGTPGFFLVYPPRVVGREF